jgi:hypothetical protein
MKRILVLLSVVALMVVMLAMSVAPAFAAKDAYNCRTSDRYATYAETILNGIPPDRNGDGIYCVYVNYNTGKATYADNHPVLVE